MNARAAHAGPGTAPRLTQPHVLRRTCACGGAEHECEECKKKKLARKAAGPATAPLAPPQVHHTLGAPGRPLDPATRATMEARFGHDFRRVRIHSGEQAAASARAVNALAYTVGHDVVLGSGDGTPRSAAERRLLAHELAHIVQNEPRAAAMPGEIVIGRPDDPAERSADAAAERVMSGVGTVPAFGAEFPGILRRQVRNHVISDFQPGAEACVVHMHGEEHTALAVAKEIRSRRCVNLMHLDTTDRPIEFEFTESGIEFTGKADPNRIFSSAGRTTEAMKVTGPPTPKDPKQAPEAAKLGSKPKATAVKLLQEFAEQVFVPKLEECRKNKAEGSDKLPVMAIHNNEGLDPRKEFKNIASKDRSPNPAMGDAASPHDFMLATQAADFDALKGSHNVVLQENPIQPKNDDGSLSVLLADQRFVNVEKEGREHDKPKGKAGLQTQDDVYVKQYAMADSVLDLYGVSPYPCAQSPQFQRRTKSYLNRRGGTSGRTTTTQSTDKPVFDRDALPDPPPEGCRLFKDQAALDRATSEWRVKLEGIPLLNVIHWVLGGGKYAPPEAMAEFASQQKCLMAAMDAGLAAKGLPPAGGSSKGTRIASGQRSFAKQEGIWSEKFAFTKKDEFDRISDAARAKCPALGTDVRWNPGNKDHKACWKSLTDDEKQKEILSASSAPGVSRHHSGMDFDIGRDDKDLDPKAWTGSGAFADAYRWLARNGSTYGFIQPFDTKGGHGSGYMSERWHWSYYPIAQAALEFIMDYEDEVDAALAKLWGDGKGGIKPEFSFIAKNWKQYVFKVEQEGVF